MCRRAWLQWLVGGVWGYITLESLLVLCRTKNHQLHCVLHSAWKKQRPYPMAAGMVIVFWVCVALRWWQRQRSRYGSGRTCPAEQSSICLKELPLQIVYREGARGSPIHTCRMTNRAPLRWKASTWTRSVYCCCWLLACLTSQQHASVCQGWICSDKCPCCPAEIEAADQTCYLIQS